MNIEEFKINFITNFVNKHQALKMSGREKLSEKKSDLRCLGHMNNIMNLLKCFIHFSVRVNDSMFFVRAQKEQNAYRFQQNFIESTTSKQFIFSFFLFQYLHCIRGKSKFLCYSLSSLSHFCIFFQSIAETSFNVCDTMRLKFNFNHLRWQPILCASFIVFSWDKCHEGYEIK